MIYQDNHIQLFNGDCRQMLELADESVQCVVTSPPYWGLRKYSGEQDLIWGDENCEHRWTTHNQPARGGRNLPDNMPNTGGNKTQQLMDNPRFGVDSNFCSLCGAWKGGYGLEPTPEMYVQHTIEILREIRRVLRKDGVVFWNIGDSYAGYWGDKKALVEGRPSLADGHGFSMNSRPKYDQFRKSGIKPKDLCLIPFRVAIAAQEDGWWVRSDIIWSKPNPMPESVQDRPTNSHEYILMLTKSAKYYWDQEAVREPQKPSSLERLKTGWAGNEKRGYPNGPQSHISNYFNKTDEEIASLAGRNLRSVWSFPTQPYPEAHFAVFPEKLPEICIKAATPEVGCCSKCGSPWERVTEIQREYQAKDVGGKSQSGGLEQGKRFKDRYNAVPETLGWQPTCKCNADKVPSLCLDPFSGAGTTLWVAKKLNRRAVGYELSEEYCQLAVERMRQQVIF